TLQHLGRDDKAVAILYEARRAAEHRTRILQHRDAPPREPDEQRRRITLADDRGALAGAATRRLTALNQQRVRAGLAQVIGGRRTADTRTNDDRVVVHTFGSTP